MRESLSSGIRRSLCLPLVAAFVACGGGGGGGDDTPPAPGPTLTAPTITSQPADANVTAGQTATFTVTAGGPAPLSYQWRRAGVDIAGATSSTYTTAALTTGDNGAIYTVVVSNSAGSVVSAGATLRVAAAGGGGGGGGAGGTSAGTLTVGGTEAASSGGTFVAQPAGDPGFPIVDAGPTCTGSGPGLVCSSMRLFSWGEFRGATPQLSELIGVTLTSNSNTAPGPLPGTNVTGVVVTYDPDTTGTGGTGPQYSLICSPGLPCASIAASGISVDAATRTVTFTNVTLTAMGGFTGSVVLNGTLAY